MYCDKITFVIFTFNEEARIERAIRNFLGSGRILVVDNHSTDRTRELSEKLGATVLLNQNKGWVEDEITAARVKATVETPWIYWGFADEMVDQPALDAILAAVESDDCSIIRIERKNYYYGVFCHDASASPTNRVFRKDAIDFTGNQIHHFGKPTVPESAIRYLDPAKYFVHHFISNTAKTYLRTMDSYTDVESTKAPPTTPAKILLRMLRTFVGNYIYRKGYKAGLPGFFLVIQAVYYEALANMKRYEFVQHLAVETIEDKNNAARDRLLEGLRGR